MARHKIEVKRGNIMKTLGKLLGYMFHYYKGRLILVICCIAVTAVAGISSSIFLEILVDDVVTPGLKLGFVTLFLCLWQRNLSALRFR